MANNPYRGYLKTGIGPLPQAESYLWQQLLGVLNYSRRAKDESDNLNFKYSAYIARPRRRTSRQEPGADETKEINLDDLVGSFSLD
ncbi:hypothetical protein HYU10_00025 [Candidatus Woesearchaeota archaeon]|nr:hypothetical protein [Candidatus Woesearchaeota archaeon]MBI2660718.1 hypothetical protein [Candidatus Woesearchaeota archaeon]